MPKYQVLVIETDDFWWNRRLEDTHTFQTEEAAKAFQEAYNKEENQPEIEGNRMIACNPIEIKEMENDTGKA